MKIFRYDLVIVGAGSAGYAAARTARALGASVALVDHGPLGGLCILRGCMPSKALLATSDLLGEIRDAAVLGIELPLPRIDMPRVIARKREMVADFAACRRGELETFALYVGHATFESPTRLRVAASGETENLALESGRFIIATGSVVAPPALPGLAEAGFVDSDAVLESDRLPESAIVLGGGYVGTELGQFLARTGVRTTFLIRSRQLLSMEDQDVGDALTYYFRDEGIDVRTGAQALRIEARRGKKVVHYMHDGSLESIAADEIFYALGRVPNVAGLDLEKAGVTYHPVTGIDVGIDLRTSAPHVFAVGDVTGIYPLVHVAIYQGELAARNAIACAAEPADYRLQHAHTIFTDPQVATAGFSEKDLHAAKRPYVLGKYAFADHGKAIAVNKTKGFVKMMASPDDGKLLGAAIIGPQASELIHEVLVALHYGATAAQFARIPHLHPTLAEIWTYPAEEIVEQLAPAGSNAIAAVN